MNRRFRVPTLLFLCLGAGVLSPALVRAHELLAQASGSAPALLPLGDGKVSLAGPAKGHLFLCRRMTGGGGAFRKGEWIRGGFWDPSRKTVAVAGDVAWPSASTSFDLSGSTRTVRGNALPSHGTGVFPVRPGDPAYNYDRNPNAIRPHDVHIALPSSPQIAAAPSCVRGEVGIALTGAYIFNGLDAEGRDAVAHEIQDSYGGHPQPAGVYHYHNVSRRLAALGRAEGGATLVGYAFDGFGIFGGVERGKTVTNDDLDECHGHAHPIPWDGRTVAMYHYHATDAYPYTVGCFRGAPVRLPPPGGPPPGGPRPPGPPPR